MHKIKNFTYKTLLLCISFLIFADYSYCETAQPAPVVAFSACQKTFIKQSEPFFYIVLSSLAKNNYKIQEVQSQNGLIIFKAYNKEFLANITKVDFKTSLIKITPTDNNYSFTYSIVDNLFKTIDNDLWQNIYKLN